MTPALAVRVPVPTCCAVVGIAVVVLSPVSSAHHSRAEYTDETTEFEGEFVRVSWSNPHPSFRFRISDAGGAERLIELQAWGSPYTLQRAGVDGGHFRTGERVRIAARESTRRENRYVLTHTLLPSGLEVVLNLNEQPRWSANSIGSQTDYFASDSEVIDAASENRGIFRVWSMPARPEPGSFATEFELTPAAAEIRASYDPLTDFAAECTQPGMPRYMSNPAAYEFLDDGAHISIRNAHYDPVRTIHLTDSGSPESQPLSPMGYSVGRWEGENVLVVRTTRINFRFFDLGGTPVGENPEVLERFTLSADQSRLYYESTTIEPTTFVGPATIRRYWIALDEEVPPANYARDCETIG